MRVAQSQLPNTVSVKSRPSHCGGSSLREQHCPQQAVVLSAWLCSHVVVSGKCASAEQCLEEKGREGVGCGGAVWGCGEGCGSAPDVTAQLCACVGQVYSVCFHLLKDTVC